MSYIPIESMNQFPVLLQLYGNEPDPDNPPGPGTPVYIATPIEDIRWFKGAAILFFQEMIAPACATPGVGETILVTSYESDDPALEAEYAPLATAIRPIRSKHYSHSQPYPIRCSLGMAPDLREPPVFSYTAEIDLTGKGFPSPWTDNPQTEAYFKTPIPDSDKMNRPWAMAVAHLVGAVPDYYYPIHYHITYKQSSGAISVTPESHPHNNCRGTIGEYDGSYTGESEHAAEFTLEDYTVEETEHAVPIPVGEKKHLRFETDYLEWNDAGVNTYHWWPSRSQAEPADEKLVWEGAIDFDEEPTRFGSVTLEGSDEDSYLSPSYVTPTESGFGLDGGEGGALQAYRGQSIEFVRRVSVYNGDNGPKMHSWDREQGTTAITYEYEWSWMKFRESRTMEYRVLSGAGEPGACWILPLAAPGMTDKIVLKLGLRRGTDPGNTDGVLRFYNAAPSFDRPLDLDHIEKRILESFTWSGLNAPDQYHYEEIVISKPLFSVDPFIGMGFTAVCARAELSSSPAMQNFDTSTGWTENGPAFSLIRFVDPYKGWMYFDYECYDVHGNLIQTRDDVAMRDLG